MTTTGTATVKRGMSEMLKGGVSPTASPSAAGDGTHLSSTTKEVKEVGADYIDESGTSCEPKPRHNGYYAGSFSGVPYPSAHELVQLVRGVQRLAGDDATRWSPR